MRRLSCALVFLLLLISSSAHAGNPDRPKRIVERYEGNPILTGDDFPGVTLKTGSHVVDCILQNVLDTAAPAGVNYGSYLVSWIIKGYCLTVPHFDHHEEARQPGNKTVLAMKGIGDCGVEARVPVQDHNVAAVILSGVDQRRTVGGCANSAQVFSNLVGLISGVVAHIEAGKRWRTHPAEAGEN